MSKSVLTDQGKEKIERLSQLLYQGELPDGDIEAETPRETESIVLQYIENQDFEPVVPDEIPTIDSLRGSSRKVFKVPGNLIIGSENYVVKFVRFRNAGRYDEWAGRKQNEYEVQVWQELNQEQKEFFVPIRDWDSDFFWIIMDYAEMFSRIDGDVVLEDGEPQLCYDREDEEWVLDQMESADVAISDNRFAFGVHDGQLKCLDYGTKVMWDEGSALDREEVVDIDSIANKYMTDDE
jgi:hypothetical protein